MLHRTGSGRYRNPLIGRNALPVGCFATGPDNPDLQRIRQTNAEMEIPCRATCVTTANCHLSGVQADAVVNFHKGADGLGVGALG